MYLALKRKGSMWILDMKIFKPIKGCKNGQILVLYRAIWNWLIIFDQTCLECDVISQGCCIIWTF